MKTEQTGPITLDDDRDNDYTLADHQSAWITLPGGKVLRISSNANLISLYVNHDEMNDPIWVMPWHREELER